MPDRVKIESSEWVVEKQNRVTSLSAAVNLSSYFPSLAQPPVKAIIQPFTKGIRYTIDGSTTPTATVGLYVAANAQLILVEPQEIADCKIIEAEASASIEYVFYNRRGVK